MVDMQTGSDAALRVLRPQIDVALIVASIAISFLGAFTSTQLMCHARMSTRLSSVFTWAILGSLIFGFCSVWSLHEVAMLAYRFDLPIGVDAPLTVLSSVLAVSFTFLALATDMLWDRYKRWKHGQNRRQRLSRRYNDSNLNDTAIANGSPNKSIATPLLESYDLQGEESSHEEILGEIGTANDAHLSSTEDESPTSSSSTSTTGRLLEEQERNVSGASHSADYSHAVLGAMSMQRQSSNGSAAFQSSTKYSGSGSIGFGSAMDFIYQKSGTPARNAFVATGKLLHSGCTPTNISKGLIWSLAITSMHYVGIFALRVPAGYYRFNSGLVILSAMISWAVCTVGCILMSQMETHLPQQILFSLLAAAGVAAMHFTGMSATTFVSRAPPSEIRGYPPALANAVVAIAFVTCVTANLLLAHSATISRNKLAEVVATRKELWRTIALKENAEAAARARSEFIASASHEIRTPLHHLQGYSDLLAQTELTEEGQSLLTAIQRATKTLSLSECMHALLLEVIVTDKLISNQQRPGLVPIRAKLRRCLPPYRHRHSRSMRIHHCTSAQHGRLHKRRAFRCDIPKSAQNTVPRRDVDTPHLDELALQRVEVYEVWVHSVIDRNAR
jgi:NO-binding membrane sensor protein with MHYT domain